MSLARTPPPIALAVAGLLAGVLALTVLLTQVSVTAPLDPESRVCGSAFDGITDRSGWQDWWSADLGETDAGARAKMLRTRHCPGAVNARIVMTAGLGGASLATGVLAAHLATRGRTQHSGRSGLGLRLRQLGFTTTVLGSVLVFGGAAGLAVLVADRDSTLFLYIDRLVVVLIGLVVLVVPLALTILGLGLLAVSRMFDDDSGNVAIEGR